MESTSSLNLEITVISGENLRINGRKPIKKNAFVVIRTDSSNSCTTKIDTEGGSYPSWNEKLAVEMPLHARFITVEVHCKTSTGTKPVGSARVPVSDFVGGFAPESYLHFLSYRLRDYNGERNGIINISVKVKLPEYASCSRQEMGIPLGSSTFGGIVTGIPVGYSYRPGNF